MDNIQNLELVALAAGLGIGWLVHWLVDLFYWRSRRVCTKVEEQLRSENGDLAAEITRLRERPDSCAECEARVVELQHTLTARDELIGRLQAEIADTGRPSDNPVDTDILVELLVERLEVSNSSTVAELRQAIDQRYDALEARLEPNPTGAGAYPVEHRQDQGVDPEDLEEGAGSRSAAGLTAVERLGPPHHVPYRIEHQWGGPESTWRAGAAWILGGRAGRPIVALDCAARPGGNGFVGRVTYEGGEPAELRASKTGHNTYRVEERSDERSPWIDAGTWLIGARWDHELSALQLSSSDGGITLDGTCQYRGEQALGFRGRATDGGIYLVDSRFSEEVSLWILGESADEAVRSLRFTSDDDGRTFRGTYSSDGESVTSIRCARWAGNAYHAETLAPAATEWKNAGLWVVGSSGKENVVAVELRSTDGVTLSGPVTYENGVVDVVHCRPAQSATAALIGSSPGSLATAAAIDEGVD